MEENKYKPQDPKELSDEDLQNRIDLHTKASKRISKMMNETIDADEQLDIDDASEDALDNATPYRQEQLRRQKEDNRNSKDKKLK